MRGRILALRPAPSVQPMRRESPVRRGSVVWWIYDSLPRSHSVTDCWLVPEPGSSRDFASLASHPRHNVANYGTCEFAMQRPACGLRSQRVVYADDRDNLPEQNLPALHTHRLKHGQNS